MSSTGRGVLILPIVILFACILLAPVNAASIYVKEGRAVYYADKVFLERAQILKKPVIVQYFGENSVSIIIADEAHIEQNTISIPRGEQFILDHNGKVSQRLRFEKTVLDNTLGTEMPGTYIEGDKAMVKFEGLFTTLLIEEGENGRRKISMAQERDYDKDTGELHLFDGYSLSLDKDNNLLEQVSFREIALGGTLKCEIDAATSFTPQPSRYNPYNLPYLPPPASGTTRSKPTYTVMKYDVPALKRIGVVPFKDNGQAESYVKFIAHYFEELLGNQVEIVSLSLSGEELEGIYLFDRAVRLGQDYNLDGIIQGRIRKFESYGAEHDEHFVKEVKLSCEIEASIVDTIGGKYMWKNVAQVKEFSSAAQFKSKERSVMKSLLEKTISSLCDDIIEKNVLEGGKQE